MDVIAPQSPALLLPAFDDWFARRGWTPRSHQLAVLAAARAGEHVLLTAPTGGGKTLAGFLPSLLDLAELPADRKARLHTLYLSPLKALAIDIRRNLETPVTEMGLPIRIETRTGDTPQARRQRQRNNPPDILLTTPEQLSLMLSYRDADKFFAHLRYVVIDELHALAGVKRGDLLALGLARLTTLAPRATRIGLSATVAQPEALTRYIGCGSTARLISGGPGPRPEIGILSSQTRVPWAGHMAKHALPEVMEAIDKHKTSLVFVNTRAQAEFVFQELWRLNQDNLAIALHHGSLSPEQRRKGRGGDDARRPAGRRLHLDAGPGHRLGRRRSGDSDRRAEGPEPAGPADRPRQPPARRAEPGAAGAVKPLRGAGMPGRGRGRDGGRA